MFRIFYRKFRTGRKVSATEVLALSIEAAKDGVMLDYPHGCIVAAFELEGGLGF
jgi:hypothetical protein